MIEEIKNFGEITKKVQANKPVLHHITNYVTAGFCADAGLAIGALPMMTDALQEVEEAAAKSDALVCNMGTFSGEHYASMRKAAAVARRNHLPIVLDPVGVMTVSPRRKAAMELMYEGVTVVKGNVAEIRSLLAMNMAAGRGVDARAEKHLGPVAQTVALRLHCLAAITGPVDVVSDGSKVVYCTNGDPLLEKITGAGCMTATLMSAALAVGASPLEGALWGITMMNVAAERAAKLSAGPGTFRIHLLDELAALTGEDLQQAFKGGYDDPEA